MLTPSLFLQPVLYLLPSCCLLSSAISFLGNWLVTNCYLEQIAILILWKLKIVMLPPLPTWTDVGSNISIKKTNLSPHGHFLFVVGCIMQDDNLQNSYFSPCVVIFSSAHSVSCQTFLGKILQFARVSMCFTDHVCLKYTELYNWVVDSDHHYWIHT